MKPSRCIFVSGNKVHVITLGSSRIDLHIAQSMGNVDLYWYGIDACSHIMTKTTVANKVTIRTTQGRASTVRYSAHQSKSLRIRRWTKEAPLASAAREPIKDDLRSTSLHLYMHCNIRSKLIALELAPRRHTCKLFLSYLAEAFADELLSFVIAGVLALVFIGVACILFSKRCATHVGGNIRVFIDTIQTTVASARNPALTGTGNAGVHGDVEHRFLERQATVYNNSTNTSQQTLMDSADDESVITKSSEYRKDEASG
nr:hypothetical protein CFP56_04098 [Quercus suber]